MAGDRGAFRLFVSSTFPDMVHERQLLHDRVFPALKQFCESHGARFQPVDLRWGVTEASAIDHRTMDICLEEIARCQRTSPKPNFLVLVGDRYGWEPVPARIPSCDFDVMRQLADPDEVILLDEWYRRDDNAVPAEHVLAPRGPAHSEYEEWVPTERDLRNTLRNLARKSGLTDDACEKFFQSATHQECVRGALRSANTGPSAVEPSEHVLACFRSIDGLPRTKEVRTSAGGSVANAFWDDRDAQVGALKEALRKKLVPDGERPTAVFEYGATWVADGVPDIRLHDDGAFVHRVLEHFRRIIEDELGRRAPDDRLDAEKRAHAQHGRDLGRYLEGRSAEMAVMRKFLRAADGGVLAVVGASGSGKSAFLGATARQTARGVLVQRYVGATPESTHRLGLVRGVVQELASTLAVHAELPPEFEALVGVLQTLLAKATAAQPIVLILDGLEQTGDRVEDQFSWLPTTLPPHAKLLISVPVERASEAGTALRLELGSLPGAAAIVLLERWLAESGRTLQAAQRSAVLDQCRGGSPLFLRLMSAEAIRWHSADTARALPVDVTGVINATLDRLEREHRQSKAGVSVSMLAQVVQYLEAARGGLSEEELLDVLARDEHFISLLERTARHPLPERRVPMAAWLRLHADLSPLLAERRVSGLTLVSVARRQVRDAVRARYGTANDARSIHGQLADYFGGQVTSRGVEAGALPNVRKLTELPYQLQRAARWVEWCDHLRDFAVMYATCAAGLLPELMADVDHADQYMPDEIRSATVPWIAFLRANQHLFAKQSSAWPVHSILVQAASEGPPNAPVTSAAHAFIRSSLPQLRTIRREGRYAKVSSRAFQTEVCTEAEVHAVRVNDLRLVLGKWDFLKERNAVRVLHPTIDVEQYEIAQRVVPIKAFWPLSEARIVVREQERLEINVPGQRLILGEPIRDAVHIYRIGARKAELLRSLPLADEVMDDMSVLNDGTLALRYPDGGVCLWDANSGECVNRLGGHTDSVRQLVEVAANRLATWSDDGTLRLWDLRTGKGKTLAHHAKGVGGETPTVGMIYALSEEFFATSAIGRIVLWRADTGSQVVAFDAKAKTHTNVSMLADGRLISACGFNMYRWDPSDRDSAGTLTGHRSKVKGFGQLGDGRLVSWCKSTLRLWRVGDAACLEVIELPFTSKDWKVVVSGMLVTITAGTTRWRWDFGDTTAASRAVTVSRAAGGLSAGTSQHYVYWRDNHLFLADGMERDVEFLPPHGKRITSVSTMPGGRVCSGSIDRSVRAWNVLLGRSVGYVSTLPQKIELVHGLPDGRVLAMTSSGAVHLLALSEREGDQRHTMLCETGGVETEWLRCATIDRSTVVLWSKCASERAMYIIANTDASWKVSERVRLSDVSRPWLLADGRVVVCAVPSVPLLLDPRDGRTTALGGDGQDVLGVSELSDRRLLTWSAKSLSLWDSQTGACLARHQQDRWVRHPQEITGNRIVFADLNELVHCWHVGSGKCVTTSEAVRVERVENTGKAEEHYYVDGGEGAVAVVGSRDTTFVDGRTGDVLGRSRTADLMIERPEVWKRYSNRRGKSADWFCAVAVDRALYVSFDEGPPVCWHGNGPIELLHVWATGAIAVNCGREMVFLQLYRGQERLNARSA